MCANEPTIETLFKYINNVTLAKFQFVVVLVLMIIIKFAKMYRYLRFEGINCLKAFGLLWHPWWPLIILKTQNGY